MFELLRNYGLSKPARPLQQLEAGQRKRTSMKDAGGTSFLWAPSAGKQQFQRRRLRRSRKDLMMFSEAPLPSRAIRLIRNAIQSLTWGLQPKNVQDAKEKKEEFQKATRIAKDLLSRPNSSDDDLCSFLGQIVEDVLIFDAGCWEYVEKPVNIVGNDVLGMEVVPGFTIALNRKWDGNPKMPRWLQVLDDGKIQTQFLDSEIEYIMMRKRSFDPFGLSPFETAVEVMDTLTNLSSYQRQIASEAYPSMLIYLGDEVDEDQRYAFRVYWENELRGRGSPGFVGGYGSKLRPEPIPLKPNGDEGLFLQFHELQTRVLAICFDLHPMDFGIQADVNRSTADVTMSATLREAVKPLAQVLATKITMHVLPRLAQLTGNKSIAEMEFFWTDIDPRDMGKQSTIDAVYLAQEVMTIDEARANINLDPLPGNLGKLTVTGFRTLLGMDPMVLLRKETDIKDLLNPPEEPPVPADTGNSTTSVPGTPGQAAPSEAASGF